MHLDKQIVNLQTFRRDTQQPRNGIQSCVLGIFGNFLRHVQQVRCEIGLLGRSPSFEFGEIGQTLKYKGECRGAFLWVFKTGENELFYGSDVFLVQALGQCGSKLSANQCGGRVDVQEVGDDTCLDNCSSWVNTLQEVHQAQALSDVAPGKRLDYRSMGSGQVSEQLCRYNLDTRLDGLVQSKQDHTARSFVQHRC